jgi:hypothetical protein
MDDNPWLARAYGIAGLAIALVIGLMSADLLLGGRISAAFGRAPALLAAVPAPADDDGKATA